MPDREPQYVEGWMTDQYQKGVRPPGFRGPLPRDEERFKFLTNEPRPEIAPGAFDGIEFRTTTEMIHIAREKLEEERRKRELLKKALLAIAEGYHTTGMNDRYIVVTNPEADGSGTHSPNLIVDVWELFNMKEED